MCQIAVKSALAIVMILERQTASSTRGAASYQISRLVFPGTTALIE